jgi:hypothetical protein
MFIKLSHYPTRKSNLINPFLVKSIYSVFNRVTEESNTKIEFVDGTFTNVYETVDEIYSLQMNQSDYTQKTIDESINKKYQESRYEIPS